MVLQNDLRQFKELVNEGREILQKASTRTARDDITPEKDPTLSTEEEAHALTWATRCLAFLEEVIGDTDDWVPTFRAFYGSIKTEGGLLKCQTLFEAARDSYLKMRANDKNKGIQVVSQKGVSNKDPSQNKILNAKNSVVELRAELTKLYKEGVKQLNSQTSLILPFERFARWKEHACVVLAEKVSTAESVKLKRKVPYRGEEELLSDLEEAFHTYRDFLYALEETITNHPNSVLNVSEGSKSSRENLLENVENSITDKRKTQDMAGEPIHKESQVRTQNNDDAFFRDLGNIVKRYPAKSVATIVAMLLSLVGFGWFIHSTVAPDEGLRIRLAVEDALRKHDIDIPDSNDTVQLIQQLSKSVVRQDRVKTTSLDLKASPKVSLGQEPKYNEPPNVNQLIKLKEEGDRIRNYCKSKLQLPENDRKKELEKVSKTVQDWELRVVTEVGKISKSRENRFNSAKNKPRMGVYVGSIAIGNWVQRMDLDIEALNSIIDGK